MSIPTAAVFVAVALTLIAAPSGADALFFAVGGMVNTMNAATNLSVLALYNDNILCWNQTQDPSGYTTWKSTNNRLQACGTIIDRVSWTTPTDAPTGPGVPCNYRVMNVDGQRAANIAAVEAVLVVRGSGGQACVYHEANGIGFNLPVYSKIDWQTACGVAASPPHADVVNTAAEEEPCSEDEASGNCKSGTGVAAPAANTASSGFTVLNLLPSSTITVTALARDNTTCAGPVNVPIGQSSTLSLTWGVGSGSCSGSAATTYQFVTPSSGSCTVTINNSGWGVLHALSALVSTVGAATGAPLCVTAAVAQAPPEASISFSCPAC